jgi:hypothetical protein
VKWWPRTRRDGGGKKNPADLGGSGPGNNQRRSQGGSLQLLRTRTGAFVRWPFRSFQGRLAFACLRAQVSSFFLPHSVTSWLIKRTIG